MRYCQVPGHVMPKGRVFFYEWGATWCWPLAAGEHCAAGEYCIKHVRRERK